MWLGWWCGAALAGSVTLGGAVDGSPAQVVDQWSVELPVAGARSGVARWSAADWEMTALVPVRQTPSADTIAAALAEAMRGGDAGPVTLAAAAALAKPAADGASGDVAAPSPEALVPLGALLASLAEPPRRMVTERLAALAGQTLPAGEDLRRDAALADPDAGVVGDVVLRVGEPAPCPGEGPGSSCVELRLSRERPLDVGDEASTSRLWVVERWWVAPDALRLAAASREVRVGWRAGDGAELQAAGTRSWTVWRDPPAPP